MANIFRISKLCAAAALCLFFLSCSGEKETVEEIVRPVRCEQVFSTGGSRSRTFSGVAKAGIESKLSFKVPGTVKKIRIKVGDTVRAGDLLAELDDVDYSLYLRKSESALKQAEAQLRNAEALYNRIRTLYETENASKTDLDNALASYETAKAMSDAGKQTRDLAQLQLDYTKLMASIDGSIASVNIEENENVQAGMTVAMLTSASRIEVEVSIPGKLISQIREGNAVTVTFDAVQNEQFEGKVTEVGISTTESSGTYPVTVKIAGDTEKIRAGMAAEVTFTSESGSGRNVIIVPSRAVSSDRNGRFVYVAVPTEDGLGFIERKQVTEGELVADGIEVIEGLEDGDRVVTAGLSKISDGMKVKLLGTKEIR